MYASLPLMTPLWVWWLWPAALAMPKSTTFTAPWRDTRMLSGLMSRWTRPSGSPVAGSWKSWAKARPSQAEAMSRAHKAGGSVQPGGRCAVFEEHAQVGPVDVLHGEEVLAVGLTEVEDLDDVGVVELGGELGLAEEHLDELRDPRPGAGGCA